MVAVTYLERLSSSAIEVKEEETERTCLTCETKFALHSGCCCSLADAILPSLLVVSHSEPELNPWLLTQVCVLWLLSFQVTGSRQRFAFKILNPSELSSKLVSIYPH